MATSSISTMNMSRRAPTPLRSTPSSAPLEAMVAKKQAHIEELIAQNRSLEHTIMKLRETINDEQARGRDAVAMVQQKWKQERTEWLEGCDSLQAAHRIAHLRTALELDRERAIILKVREDMRLERLARLQRDNRLVAFQRRESELEARVEELSKELLDQQEVLANDQETLNQELEQCNVELADIKGQLRDAQEELVDVEKQKQKAETLRRLSGSGRPGQTARRTYHPRRLVRYHRNQPRAYNVAIGWSQVVFI